MVRNSGTLVFSSCLLTALSALLCRMHLFIKGSIKNSLDTRFSARRLLFSFLTTPSSFCKRSIFSAAILAVMFHPPKTDAEQADASAAPH